jgi:DNA-directed RNA polymerase specialized sigma24 family protein
MARRRDAGDAADQDEMLQALDSVPKTFREVLLPIDVEGFNKSEAQAILGIPAEVVASRLAEARTHASRANQIWAALRQLDANAPLVANGVVQLR